MKEQDRQTYLFTYIYIYIYIERERERERDRERGREGERMGCELSKGGIVGGGALWFIGPSCLTHSR